jgi:hypothetical protein
MNIDIIMSPKDLGNTQGLCGNFDGDPNNDFVLKDGTQASNNNDYRFSESWRYSLFLIFTKSFSSKSLNNFFVDIHIYTFLDVFYITQQCKDINA